MKFKIDVKQEERKIQVDVKNKKEETIKEKNKKKSNRKEAFIRGTKHGEEEEEVSLLELDDIPIYFYGSKDGRLAIYRMPAAITKHGIIRTGDFIIYVENEEQYTRVKLEIEDIAYMIRRLDVGINYLETPYEIKEDIEIYNHKEADNTFSIFLTKDRRIAFFIRNGDLLARAIIDIIQATYLLKILNIEFENTYYDAHELREEILNEIKKGVTPQSKKSHDWEEMMYG